MQIFGMISEQCHKLGAKSGYHLIVDIPKVYLKEYTCL